MLSNSVRLQGHLSSAFARLYSTGANSTLVVVEHNGTQVAAASLAAFSAAKKFGGSITAFVGGSKADSVAAEVSKIAGVNKVIVAKSSSLDTSLPENLTPVLTSLQAKQNFSHIVATHSAFGKNLLPRVAALLDVAQISDVLEVISQDTFKRPLYAGNVLATVSSADKVKVVTVRQTAFPKAESGSTQAPIEEFKADAPASDKVEFVEAILAKSDRPELTSASKVVAGGRALKSSENFKIIYDLADKMGAAVGASRAAVDAGYVSNDLQIGQTGKIVAPELYIAVGISGAIQHLAGMKDAKVIACINKDPEAPIFQVSDFGLVADLFKAVPEMTQKL